MDFLHIQSIKSRCFRLICIVNWDACYRRNCCYERHLGFSLTKPEDEHVSKNAAAPVLGVGSLDADKTDRCDVSLAIKISQSTGTYHMTASSVKKRRSCSEATSTGMWLAWQRESGVPARAFCAHYLMFTRAANHLVIEFHLKPSVS